MFWDLYDCLYGGNVLGDERGDAYQVAYEVARHVLAYYQTPVQVFQRKGFSRGDFLIKIIYKLYIREAHLSPSLEITTKRKKGEPEQGYDGLRGLGLPLGLRSAMRLSMAWIGLRYLARDLH